MLHLASEVRALSVETVVLGALLIELERMHPGICDRVAAITECEATRAQVVRLRGPIVSSETRAILDLATRVAQAMASVAKAAPPRPEPPRQRWWASVI